MTSSLFIRPPETLEDYKPTFTREEVKLHLEEEQHQVGGEGMFRGFGAFEEDDPRYQGPPRYEYTFYVTVAGYRFTAPGPFHGDSYDKAAQVANSFLAMPANEKLHHEAWTYLRTNSRQLNRDKMYWKAMDHRAEVDKVKAEIRELQDRVERAEHLASLYAIEVKRGERLDETGRAIVWAELTGGELWPPR